MRVDVGSILEWPGDGLFHACLCDPPYHLTTPVYHYQRTGSGNFSPGREAMRGGFMGKTWDGGDVSFRPETWARIAEHLYPGAFLFAFAGARTYHRIACAIEDAGFTLHSMLGFVTGQGFPKATRIDTQIDKAAGAEQDVLHSYERAGRSGGIMGKETIITRNITAPATPLAATWSGHRYGLQSLKPALEPIICAQKPYAGKPVDSIAETGAGALWVDGGRVGTTGNLARLNKPGDNGWKNSSGGPNNAALYGSAGRWPPNFALDETAAAALDAEVDGGPSRFFPCFDYALERLESLELPFKYTAKASRSERNMGLVNPGPRRKRNVTTGGKAGAAPERPGANNHPTVKPLALTRWLATLLLPPPEYAPRRILVPFAGSGSEMIGAELAGWEEIVGVELEAEYAEIARARLAHWLAVQPVQIAKAEVAT